MKIESKSQVTYFSVGVNILLTLGKLAVGIATGSAAIISEAAHSASDLVTSLISLFSVREAEKPPDQDHPYGHGKYENFGSFAVALMIIASGIYVCSRALRELIFGVQIQSIGLGAGVMLGAAVANYFISAFLIKMGKKFDSPAIEADGWHSRSDVFTAGGVFVSLVIIHFTGWYALDPAVAILISWVILYVGVHIGYEAFSVLVDSRIPVEAEEKIRRIIEARWEDYIEYHSFRARKAGSQVDMDLHLVFPDSTSLAEAHKVTEELERQISGIIPGTRVLIHIEPCDNGQNIRDNCRHQDPDQECSLADIPRKCGFNRDNVTTGEIERKV